MMFAEVVLLQLSNFCRHIVRNVCIAMVYWKSEKMVEQESGTPKLTSVASAA